MDERGILEVETPALSRAGATDPNIHSLRSRVELPDEASGCDIWLHTSPEFPMKRLLAAGSGPIYQIARVFRDGEAGRLHQPEFTMLEWYRPGLDHQGLMHEINDLLTTLGLEPAARRTYREAFLDATGLDPHGVGTDELGARAWQQGLRMEGIERSAIVEFLFSTEVAPRLAEQGNTFIYDYPAEEAALARIRPGTPPVAERFELFMAGVEIANGFHELGDADEQRRRFLADNGRRVKLGRVEVPVDERLLDALANGLPACAGVAVGLDRLLMMMAGCDRIDEVIAFPFPRA
jgi:lysyl-tRNA synthetase class 2